MEYKIFDHIRTKASLVILVIDDYTNKVISDGSIQVFIEGASKPIRKSEGYYVFINLELTRVNLTIKSDWYSTLNRDIDLSTLNKKEPIIKIRVKPNKNYSLQKGTTCLQGLAEPLSEVRVICDNIQKYFRLLYDYDGEEKKDEIYIYNPDKSDLDGKIFIIKDKDDKGNETFIINNTKDRDNNLYQIENGLENTYKKVGTKIFPVFVTQTDENGEYFIPLWNLGEEKVNCQCEMIGRQKINQSIPLEIGKVNKFNFN